MDSSTVSILTEVILDILLGTYTLVAIGAFISIIQSVITSHRYEKREQEREKRDAEYHEKRMNDLK